MEFPETHKRIRNADGKIPIWRLVTSGHHLPTSCHRAGQDYLSAFIKHSLWKFSRPRWEDNFYGLPGLDTYPKLTIPDPIILLVSLHRPKEIDFFSKMKAQRPRLSTQRLLSVAHLPITHASR